MNGIARRRFLALAAATACVPAVAAKPATSNAAGYAQHGAARAFIEEMVARHGFSREELELVFARARFQPAIVRAMTPSTPGQRSWITYRRNAVNAQRIDAGLEFWQQHAAALARAEAEFGVPAEIVVGIIGVETIYGRNTGNWRVIDALTTLAFDYPRRAEFFRGELEQFLLAARDSNLDTLGMRGSYAGAMGIPQFMPGSYRRYAVDFDGDGRRDLFASPVDAIGSVANFLRQHGWTPGEAVAVPARAEGERWRTVADGGVEPVRTMAELTAAGVATDAAIHPDTRVVLVELDAPDSPATLWVGFRNFHALTRYNRSSFYAIAVLELGTAVRTGLPAAMTARP
jgi:membrane-bound lytic murein transglycosylase B